MTQDRLSDHRGESALETLIAKTPGKLSYAQLHRFLQRQAHKEGVPLHGSFELTPLCNLDCKMCYVHLSKSQMCGKELLSANQWKRLISEAAELGMMDATLTGGECLTYPEFDEVYLHLQDLGIRTAVYTNGILLTEERVRFFKEHPVSHIQVTLYGSSEDEYEAVTGHRMFARVTENIQRAHNAGLNLNIAITPNRFLSDGGAKLVEYAVGLGLSYTINSGLFMPRQETGRHKDDIDLSIDDYIRLFQLRSKLNHRDLQPLPECDLPPTPSRSNEDKTIRGLRCAAGSRTFSIRWDGTLVPCSMLKGVEEKPLDGGFFTAWRTIRQGVLNYPIPVECESCVYKGFCTPCVVEHAAGAPAGHASPLLCERVKALTAAGLMPVPSKNIMNGDNDS